jgi:hypothetical protein
MTGVRSVPGHGASRAVDYFETIDEVDETRVVIEGLSRYGKAALVALAYEPRIAIGFIGSSGRRGQDIKEKFRGTGRKPCRIG